MNYSTDFEKQEEEAGPLGSPPLLTDSSDPRGSFEFRFGSPIPRILSLVNPGRRARH